MIKSAAASSRSIAVVDTGPLIAAVDRRDPDHAWAVRVLTGIRGRFLTGEAMIAEAQHGLGNHRPAVAALWQLVQRMEVIPLGGEGLSAVFTEAESWAPRMDFADACALALARRYGPAFVLTTDFRDFSAYRIPFVCPRGVFLA